MGDFIEVARATLRPDATPVWVDDIAFLHEQKIAYELPWMIAEGDNEQHLQIDNRQAVASGLTFRPIPETLWDTLAHWPNRLAQLLAGQQPIFRWIATVREREVHALWKARRG